MTAPLLVQADNALGSARGDVDDAFALAALFAAGVPIACVASVFGNTREAEAYANNRALAEGGRWDGPHVHGAARPGVPGAEAASAMRGARVLALGPLTDVAAALATGAPAEVILVGANLSSRGRWPPLWPFEYNLVKDRAATNAVFASGVPLTIVPLDVAKRLRADAATLAALGGPLGARLREGSARWHRRARRLTLARSVPVWDLVAAMWVIDPSPFRTERQRARAHHSGWVEFGIGREVRVVAGFEKKEIWRRFLRLLAA